MAESGRQRWVERGLMLLAGAALRLWFVRHANPLQGDPLLYGNIARNWLEHGIYSFVGPGRPLIPTLIRLPGYPLFLMVCFRVFGVGNYAAVELVQVVLDLVGCVVIARLAENLFGERAGRWALLLAVLCPFTANYTATPLTETLTLLTIGWSFLALERVLRRGPGWQWWLGSLPVALAYSLLLRPEQGLLAAVVVPAVGWGLYRREGMGRAMGWVAVISAVTLLPLVPWTVRNWRTFHVIQPLAPHYATDPGEAVPLGFQRWFRSWAVEFASTEEVYWNYDGSAIAMEDLPERAFDTAAQREATAQLLADYNVNTAPTAVFDARFGRLAAERIRSHPVRYWVGLPLARLANMLLRPRTELMNTQLAWWKWREAQGQTVFAGFYAALNLLYLAMGVAGWWRARKTERVVWVAMTVFVVLRCCLLLTLDNAEPRYTLEFFPLWIVWAGALVALTRREHVLPQRLKPRSGAGVYRHG